MSFVALAVHVLLLMLVCWMGAETLASDDRLARQVFGKLSVLFGMYALMCLIIDFPVINLSQSGSLESVIH